MKLQYRLLLLTGLLGLLFLAGFYLLQQGQMANVHILIDERQAQLEGLTQQIITLEGSSLEVFAYDYSYWDDLVSFIKTRDQTWANNLLSQSLKSFHVDAIWIVSNDYQLVYSTGKLPGVTLEGLPLTQVDYQNLFKDSAFAHFNYRLPDQTMVEVRGATIHPSADAAHKTPGQGFLFVGRAWDQARLDKLSSLIGGKASILPSLDDGGSAANAGQFQVTAPLLGIDQQPAGYLQGSFSNGYFDAFRQAGQRDLAYYLLFVLIFLAVLFGALVLWVNNPVNKLSASLAQDSTLPLHNLLKEKNEFGNIARLVNEFFEGKELMTRAISNHQRIEGALRKSEERYRIISELTSDAAYSLTIHPDGAITADWGAEAIQRLTGYPLDQFTGSDQFNRLIHADGAQGEDGPATDAAEMTHAVVETHLVTPQGERRWIRNQAYPVLDPDTHQVVRIYGAVQDITAEKNALEDYHALVDQSTMALAIFHNGQIRFSNPAFSFISGHTNQEIQNTILNDLLEFIHPDDQALIRQETERVTGGEKPSTQQEIRVQHKDGHWMWWAVEASRIDYQGDPALQVIAFDITERKQVRQELEDQQKFSSTLWNTMDLLVVELELDGRIRNCNIACERLTAREKSELSSMYLWEVFEIPDTSPLSSANFQMQVKDALAVKEEDILYTRDDWHQWFSWSQSYITGSDGRAAYVVGTGLDITSRKIRERQSEIIATIASTTRGTLSRNEILVTFLEKILSFLSAESAAVGFPLPDMQEIELELVRGRLEGRLVGRRFTIEDSIIGEVFKTGKPYLSNNLLGEKKYATKDLLDKVRTGAWVPLVVDTTVIGVLVVSSSRTIFKDEFELLMPIADMAASAVHRASLTDQTQRRLQHLTTLRTINIAIGASLDLRVTLNVLVNQITTQLGVDAVDVLLLDPDTRSLHYAAGHGFRSKSVEVTQLWLGEAQAGRVALERHSQHIYDPKGIQTYFAQQDCLSEDDFVAYDAVPLTVKGEVKGVLETFHRAPYRPSTDWIQLLEALALETAIAIDNAELLDKLQRSNVELAVAYDGTIEGWARALELRDRESENHTKRVADATIRLAQALGISGAPLMHIRRGALLHDIGKMGIPDNILLKPDVLTPDEWIVMRQHAQFAYDMLATIPFLRPALEIPYSHHEHWDGSGYPQGLKGEEIPITARIFSIIDVYDALTHDRPYRLAWPEAKALEYLREQSGVTLDPQIVKVFLDMFSMLYKNK